MYIYIYVYNVNILFIYIYTVIYMCISFIYSYTEQPPKRDADKVLVNGHMLGKDLLLPDFLQFPRTKGRFQ